mmetsp:Transcript_16792/g.43406  ORF Transcript_16792/g.43406 Transcript_16792/m.43406 type:complete len:203 (-) Transcript_16792:170-778(-)
MSSVPQSSLAAASASSGHVADSISSCLSGGSMPKNAFICGSHTRGESNSSASSRTTKLVRRGLIQRRFVSSSSSRPGVATSNSGQRPKSGAPSEGTCKLASTPPYTAPTRMVSSPLVRAQKRSAMASVCCAISRVGSSTNAMGPSPASSGSWAIMCTRAGSKKANVFPLPVGATATTSAPARAQGQTWACTGKGSAFFVKSS